MRSCTQLWMARGYIIEGSTHEASRIWDFQQFYGNRSVENFKFSRFMISRQGDGSVRSSCCGNGVLLPADFRFSHSFYCYHEAFSDFFAFLFLRRVAQWISSFLLRILSFIHSAGFRRYLNSEFFVCFGITLELPSFSVAAWCYSTLSKFFSSHRSENAAKLLISDFAKPSREQSCSQWIVSTQKCLMGVAIILRKTSAPCSAVKLNVESLVVLSQTFAQHGKKTKFISNSLKTMTNLKKKIRHS